MRLERGFRVPEVRDKAIQWPARGREADPITAMYSPAGKCWLVLGSDKAWGNPLELVNYYGNDWVRVYIEIAPEASA